MITLRANHGSQYGHVITLANGKATIDVTAPTREVASLSPGETAEFAVARLKDSGPTRQPRLHRRSNRTMRLIAVALEFGHNLGIRRWVGRLQPYAEKWWFPPLSGALSAAATLSLTIPVGPMLMALVTLNPRRWRAVVIASVLGSAVAGALFTHLLGHFGSAWINERLPQLAAAKHWHYMVSWVSNYGFVTLAAIAASPFSQTPALILAAVLGLPWPEVFGALMIGKGLKYSLVGAVTERTANGVHAVMLSNQASMSQYGKPGNE